MLSINRRYYLVGLLLVSFILVFTLSAYAANIDDLNKELDKQEQQKPESSNLFVDFLKLILILGIIVGAAWSIVRIFGNKVNARMQGTWLNIVDEVMLGQNRGIVLCEIGQKLYALGVTDHNISFLFEVDNPKLLEDISQGSFDIQPANTDLVIKKPIKSLLNYGRISKRTERKDFHVLMEDQLTRLKDIAQYNNSPGVREKRSDKDE